MASDGSVREGLLGLREAASAILPVRGVGVIRPDTRDHLSMTYVDVFGVTGFRYRTESVPEPARPPASGPGRLTPVDLEANPEGPVETRLRLTGMPDGIRGAFAAAQALALPLSGIDPPGVLLLGLAEADPLPAARISAIDALAARAADLLNGRESPEAELERLRRLDAVDRLLPDLLRVLDIRQAFDRLSALTREVLPHDVLGLYSEDLTRLTVYAHASPREIPDISSTRYPCTVIEPWVYHIIDDLSAHPFERDLALTRAGGRSSLRVAIRLDEALFGALNFTSRETARYTTADLSIGRRIADYVAFALSHQRLAQEVRRAEELRARAATNDLLDELLASLTDTGELNDAFDRVSAIAKKVLPHDALALPVLLPGRRVRAYASSGAAFPEVVDLPDGLRKPNDWEHDIIPDLKADPTERGTPPARLGYRSCLRVAIRLDGQLAGALDFLSFAPGRYKPTDLPVARRIADRIALTLSRERRVAAIHRADEATARASELEARVRALTEELNARAGYRRVIGDSPPWRQVLTQAAQVAATETTVLLLGQSGTGKEVVARFLHGASPRGRGPFVALNCAALPENLLEAELFGYERGAFTGATQSKPGQLEQAGRGTLFLDEVAEMSPPAQAKFLRVLQEREFQRLGGTRVLKTDARVVAATNRDLHQAMERGQFREDLYYRLNVFAIRLPPLRERRDDILPLTEAFVSEIGRTLGRPPGGVSREARQSLLEYDWPGNVRELRNVLERAAILADGGLIAAEHLRPLAEAKPRREEPLPASVPVVAPVADSSSRDLKSVEREMIERALQDTRFNKSEAAKRLGLTRAQLYVRLRRHGLE